jgi:WD40 repeat protein
MWMFVLAKADFDGKWKRTSKQMLVVSLFFSDCLFVRRYSIWGLLRLRPQLLCSASADSLVSCWDTETLQRVESAPMAHPGAKIYCMAGAGDMLYTGSADRSVRVREQTTLCCFVLF